MYTKSIIQQTIEKLHEKDSFRIAIENLMDKYIIEDSVFAFRKGYMQEVVEGYFVTESNHDNLSEAIADCDPQTMVIRITGDKFQVGRIYNTLAECADNEKVFDLQRFESVR